MERLSVIDIGSNSVRLVLADIKGKGSFKIIDEIKESIRLGEDIELNGYLSEEKIQKTLKTLATFKDLCGVLKSDKIVVVATEAVRTAKNKENLLRAVKEELDLDITILTGEEECRLDYFAVIKSMYTGNSLIVDIGGSSTELIWIYNNKIMESATLPFGAVNLTKRYNLHDIINPSDDEALKSFLKEQYSSIPWLFKSKFDNIIGIGGSIRNIGKIDRKRKRYPLDIAHNYYLTALDVNEIYHMAKSKNLKQRLKIEGLSKERADIFVAGASSLNTLVEMLGVEDIRISGKGIREGIIYEYMSNKPDTIADILDSSLEGVLSSHDINRDHAEHVYRLTDKLFDHLKPLHNLDDSYKNILKTAALLHDCGISVRYYNHHKHSFYIIINSQINGLSHKELLMSAYVAAFHRNNDFDISICQFSGIINRLDAEEIRKIGVLLRLAEGLDRSMVGIVKDINCEIKEDSVILKLSSDRDLNLEINEAYQTKNKFKDIYNKDLIIEKC